MEVPGRKRSDGFCDWILYAGPWTLKYAAYS